MHQCISQCLLSSLPCRHYWRHFMNLTLHWHAFMATATSSKPLVFAQMDSPYPASTHLFIINTTLRNLVPLAAYVSPSQNHAISLLSRSHSVDPIITKLSVKCFRPTKDLITLWQPKLTSGAMECSHLHLHHPQNQFSNHQMMMMMRVLLIALLQVMLHWHELEVCWFLTHP